MAYDPDVRVEDLQKGLNEWRNIQDVVRLTFKAFHDALHAQGDAIRWLESALEGKADNEDMWLALQDKASHSELSSRVHELSSSLACKAEKGDAQPASSTEQRFSSLEHSISALQRDLSSERSSRQSHSHELSDELASLRSLARENSHAVTSLREHLRSSGCSPSDSLRDHLQHYIDDVKREADRANSAIEACKERLSQQEHSVDALQRRAHRKAESDDVDQLRRHMLTVHSFHTDPTEELQALKRRLEHLESSDAHTEELKKKADARDLSLLSEEVKGKADMQDVGTLLDSKAGVEEVNDALKQVSESLEQKASAGDVNALQQRLHAIPTGPRGESSVGRWVWKSGKTKSGGLPWNAEAVNTDPSNLLYERDKPTIQTVIPGLYEVNFGVFTAKRPQVQLLVNGEPVLSAVNSSTYAVHHSSGRLASTAMHSAGNVTGLSLIDFLSLPANAKIAISFEREEKGTGFLCLKKL